MLLHDGKINDNNSFLHHIVIAFHRLERFKKMMRAQEGEELNARERER